MRKTTLICEGGWQTTNARGQVDRAGWRKGYHNFDFKSLFPPAFDKKALERLSRQVMSLKHNHLAGVRAFENLMRQEHRAENVEKD